LFADANEVEISIEKALTFIVLARFIGVDGDGFL
jgi:hypothetical protein